MIISVDFKNKTLAGLIEKQADEIPVPKEHSNYEKTVAAVKWIIDQGQDIDNGFTFEFNNTYTIVTKRKNEFFK